ncbi:MAG: hypothetical protein CFK52_07540 [Chloracidobacterium sp. CP2_5A]|nr:MAG: hypothetical protein CFK52_07540 [Chloracidobacterium sp. CP2_5A]
MLIWGLLIGALGWGAFGQTVAHGYVIDDASIVQSNPNAAATADLGQLFGKHYWQDTSAAGRESRNFHYRPLTIASYALVARLLGDGPERQHLANVAAHVLVAWLVLLSAYAWLQDAVAAGLTGLYFVAHPLHTEAVAMIVGRAELLAAAGALGALVLALLEFRLELSRPDWQRWLLAAAAGLCLLLGWLAKESAVLFFPLWMLILWSSVQGAGRFRLRAWVAAGWRVGVACGLSTLGFWLVRQSLHAGARLAPMDFPMNPLAYASLAERWATGVVLLMKYVVMHLWAFPLQADYSFNSIPVVTDWRDGRLWLALAELAGVGALLWTAYRHRSPAWVGLAFLFAGAAAFSHFARPLGFVFAERVMYLPSVGYCLAVAVGFRAAWDAASGASRRWPLAVALALLIGGAAWQTQQEASFYRDTQTALARSLAVGNQRSVWLWHAYGTELLNAGRPAEAVAALERARAILPLAESCAVQAKAYFALGRREPALAAAEEAVKRDPTWMPYRELYGALLFESGRADEAAAQFEAALALAPDDATLHAQMAVICRRQGRTGDAIERYARALELAPNEAGWRIALGDLQREAGNVAQARACYRKVLETSSDAMARRAAEAKLRQLDASGSF